MRLLAKEGAFAHEVRIDGRIVNVGFSGSDDSAHDPDDNYVSVWMDRGTDTRLVGTIGKRFDAELATGAYDRHFHP